MLPSEIETAEPNLIIVKKLLSYPLVNWVGWYFTRMRDGDAQLRFVDLCRDVLKNAPLYESEYRKYDVYLTMAELAALDRLNRFGDYIRLFEKTLAEKRYDILYASYREEPRFGNYMLWEDVDGKHVHFLYLADERYEIIRSKRHIELAEALGQNLLRKQSSDLTEQEKAARLSELYDALQRYSERSGLDVKKNPDI